MQRRTKASDEPPQLAALGIKFSGGDLRPRGGYWYEPEDKYVFEHFFSLQGGAPYKTDGMYLELGALDGVLAGGLIELRAIRARCGLLLQS